MTNTEYDEIELKCRQLIDKWHPLLGLGFWHIEVCYYDDTDEFVKANGNRTVMRCYASWEYLDIKLTICLPHINDLTDDRLEYAIVHELCHALVNEMREPDEDLKHEERVVTMLAKAFIWTRDLTIEELKNE